MAGYAEGGRHVLCHADRLVKIRRHELAEGFFGIRLIIQRQGGLVPGIAIPVGPLGFPFLQVGTVRQENAAEVKGGVGAMDRAFEALLDQHGQIAGMIDMRVGQDDRVNGSRVYRQRLPVAQAQLLVALEQAAIDQDARLACVDQVFRSGDGADAAKELDLKCHVSASLMTAQAMVGCAATQPLDIGQSHVTPRGACAQACLFVLRGKLETGDRRRADRRLAQVPDRFGECLDHVLDFAG